jgi:hypothetical protein
MSLPLQLQKRYGRKEAFASVGIDYSAQKQHLNVGLPPQCPDGSYLIFITLNKEKLDPAHNYADELFADQFIWVTRRGVTENTLDYVNLRMMNARVSLFVRTEPGEDFVYAGELSYDDHEQFTDPSSGRSQMRFFWKLKQPLPEPLYQELIFGLPNTKKDSPGSVRPHSRPPSSFDELRKAYSYVLGTAERTVVPEHQNYQVRLKQFLLDHNIGAVLEKDFVDVGFFLDGKPFIGEIKVTRNLTLPQAFRAGIGQVLEYGHLLFADPPHMILFLDQVLDQKRLKLATLLKVAVVAEKDGVFTLLNPESCHASLKNLFAAASSSVANA